MIFLLFMFSIPQNMLHKILVYRQNIKELELKKIKEENKRLKYEEDKAKRELLEFDRRLGIYSDENTVLYEDEEYMQGKCR